jgi:hypothetical protein
MSNKKSDYFFHVKKMFRLSEKTKPNSSPLPKKKSLKAGPLSTNSSYILNFGLQYDR